eukprot:6471982-Amphidinium_carterae.1
MDTYTTQKPLHAFWFCSTEKIILRTNTVQDTENVFEQAAACGEGHILVCHASCRIVALLHETPT